MMKKLVLVLLVAILASCDKTDLSACANKICTTEYAMVIVQFVNSDGEGVSIKNFSAVNQRTNDTIYSPPASHYLLTKGSAIVASDSDIRNLSKEGDDIKVSATDSLSNETKTGIIKVAGGKCACHISKVSGPQQIKFD